MNDMMVDARSLEVGYSLFGAGSGAPDDSSAPRRSLHSRDPRAGSEARPESSGVIAGQSVATLLSRIKAGDRDALTIVYRAVFPSLWRLAMLRLRSAEAAEEVVHDIFLSLWMRRATLRIDSDIQVYLASAVRNRTRNIRAHERVVESVEQSVDRAVLDLPAMGEGIPVTDAALETQEFWEAYRRALGLLTEREREAVLLRWEEHFTLEQVGGVLGMSTMGARALILRAQRKVQASLSEYRG